MQARGLTVLFSACVLVAASCGGGLPGMTAADPSLQRFAVSLQGEDIGYMQMEVEPLGRDSLTIRQETAWDLVLMGNRRHVVMSLTAVSDTLLNLGSLEFSLSDGSAVISSSTVRRGGELVTSVASAGRTIEMSSTFEGDYIPAVVDLAAARMTWSQGQSRSFPAFDAATGTVSEASVECIGFEPAVLLGDTVDAAKLEIRHMGTVTDAWVFQGQIIREVDEGLAMEMVRVPPGQAGDVYSNRDLYEVFAVSSTPIDDPRRPGTRTYSLEGEVDWTPFQLSYPPVQSASGTIVTVTAVQPGTVVPFPAAADTSFSAWLAPEPMIQSDDESIVKVADSLTAGAADCWSAACAICSFVDTAVENSPTVSLPSSVEVLQSLRGDCNEHTVLFVALARAAGLPARTCAGIVYLDGVFGYHAWPLVWVGEWVPMDPTFGQMVADPTHIILAEGDLEAQYVITSVMGRLRVVELEEGGAPD